MAYEDNEFETSQQSDVEEATKIELPPDYKVILYNDDYTTKDFVVDVLETVFHKTTSEAITIMESVHKTGRGVAGIYSYDIAMTRASLTVQLARAQHHEFITPEHLLRQALNYRSVLSVLLTSGGDVTGIRKGLDEYLKKNIPVIAPVEEKKQSARAKKIAKTKTEHNSALEQNPIETMAFQAVMDRTCTHCVSSDKDVIDFSDVLVSMIDETKNYCSYILKQSGIERLKLIEVISYMRNNEQLLQNDTTTITPQDKQRMMEDMMRVIDNNESTQKKNTDATPIPDGYGDNVFQPQQPGGASTKTALEKYTTNLTQLAKDGKLETLIGREDEIERTVQILCRRTKNNPLHVGDAGVGKTAITEGLAVRIVNGEVPELLKDFSIYSLSMGTVLAGTRFRGDFEERLKQITDELMKKEKAILFIDEIHTIIGAGSVSNGTVY